MEVRIEDTRDILEKAPKEVVRVTDKEGNITEIMSFEMRQGELVGLRYLAEYIENVVTSLEQEAESEENLTEEEGA